MSTTKFLVTLASSNGRNLLVNRQCKSIFELSQRDYRPPSHGATIKTRLWPKGNRPNRGWNMKFSYMRKLKFIPVDLSSFPSYDQYLERAEAIKAGPDEIRSYMKKKGFPPTRPYKDRGRDRPIHVAATGGIFEAYVPPEGDGRASRLTREGIGQVWDQISSKSRELIKHVRTVRRYDEEFDPKTFSEKVALPVFTDAHKALSDRDIDRLHELVTEYAFTVMYEENKLRTVQWEMVESIEPPRVVHVRATGVLHDDNVFGQVTVRMHTKQKLAIYDQFGRLYLGSNDIARDVLEYVVFERHLVDPYGAWRLHAKITPKWLPPKEASITTYKKKEFKKHNIGADVKAEEFVPVVESEGDKSSVSSQKE